MNGEISINSFYINDYKKENVLNLNEKYIYNNICLDIYDIIEEVLKDTKNNFLEEDKKTYQVKSYKEFKKGEKKSYRSFFVKISSGIYGDSSEIFDANEELKYKKQPTDVEVREIFMYIVIPNKNEEYEIKKGIIILQNRGNIGIKSITHKLANKFLHEKYELTINFRTISRKKIIEQFLAQTNIKEISLIRNEKSKDITDTLNQSDELNFNGIKEKRTFYLKGIAKDKIKNIKKIMYKGLENEVVEFENNQYEKVTVKVEYNGKDKTVTMNNLNNVSIIESIPDDVKEEDDLIKYLDEVTVSYLKEMGIEMKNSKTKIKEY